MEQLIFYQIDQFRVDDLNKKSGNAAVNDNENKQQGSNNNAIVISTQKRYFLNLLLSMYR